MLPPRFPVKRTSENIVHHLVIQTLKLSSRFNQMRPDLLKKISKIASYDWAAKGFPIAKEHFADGNTWNSVNLSGRREGPLYVEEPNFVLVKEEPQMDLLGGYSVAVCE